jgi:hypothetical protein
MLATDPIFNVFCGKMLHVWDANHRVQAWMPIINQDHQNDLGWHYSVDSIILEVKGDIPTMLTALHEVNWYDFYYFLILLSCSLCLSFHN